MIFSRNKLPIKKKLIALQHFLVLIVLLLTGPVILFFFVEEEQNAITRHLNSTAKIICLNIASSLMFFDSDMAEQVLSSAVVAEGDVVNAWVKDKKGHIFSSYHQVGFETFDMAGTTDPDNFKSGKFLIVASPVISDSERIGTVYLRASLSRYNDAIHRSILLLVLIFGVSLVAAFLFSRMSQKVIIWPIQRLAKKMEEIVEENSFDHQIEKRSDDEIGNLYDAFNALMIKIHQHREERDEVLKALKKSENSLLMAQKIAKTGSWELNLETGEVGWSQQLSEIFEMRDEPYSEELFYSRVHPDDRDRVREILEQTVEDRHSSNIEYRLLLPSGVIKYISDTGDDRMEEDGKVKILFGTIQDISALKKAELAIRKLNIELEERVRDRTRQLVIARDKAEDADRLKSAFLAAMSHELRTPLNSIIGFTGIILQGIVGPLNEEQRKQLGMVLTSSRHLLDLINDVLDISKIEAGQLKIGIAEFELKSSFKKIQAMLSPLAEKKGLNLDLIIPEDLPTLLNDKRRLEQVIINVANNAIKFTEKGFICIQVAQKGHYVMITVEDTGIGIKEKDFDKLFAPFQQIDTGLNRKHEGTGLGLSICKKLLDLMEGSIQVQSVVGEGSIFTISVPITHSGKGVDDAS